MQWQHDDWVPLIAWSVVVVRLQSHSFDAIHWSSLDHLVWHLCNYYMTYIHFGCCVARHILGVDLLVDY